MLPRVSLVRSRSKPRGRGIASPGLWRAAAASALPFAPGIARASELMQALAAGFDLVKFFPAEQAGGIKALRALAGPFPNILICPTGGIGEANAASWLAEPNVVAVGGFWLCPAGENPTSKWAGVTRIFCRGVKYVETALKFFSLKLQNPPKREKGK